MKVIIAGSRTITDPDILDRAILNAYNEKQIVITEIVSGGAAGADRLGEKRARANAIPLRVFPANWARDAHAAGFIRNRMMAVYADALIALWDGKSRGTANMIDLAEKKGIPVWVERI